MGRQLRTKIPVVPSTLEPRWVESKQLQDKQEEIKRKQKKTYDRYHRARPLGILQPGDSVWVQDAKTSGTVIKQTDSPRSYLVRTPTSCLRRNRRHLVPTPNEHTSVTDSPSTSCQDRRSLSPEEQPKEKSPNVMRLPVAQPVTTITRSGRLSAPPKRLDL